MKYGRNLSTTGLNGLTAALMMVRVLAYAKVLDVPEFGAISVALLVSSSLSMVNGFGLFLLMQRDLPRLFASGRWTRAIVLLFETTLMVAVSAAVLLVLSATGIEVAGAHGTLLALSAIHGMTNQLFGAVTTESKSRLLQAEFANSLFVRSIAISVSGVCAALLLHSAASVLVAEIVGTVVMTLVALWRMKSRYGKALGPLVGVAVRHLPRAQWRTAMALFLTTVFAFLMQNADRWTASLSLDKHGFALFAFAWTLMSMASTLQTTINVNLFPAMAAGIHEHGAAHVRHQTTKFSLQLLAVLGVLALPGFLIIHWGIPAYFPQYAEVLSYIPIFLAAAAFRSSDFWSNYLIIGGKTRLLFAGQVSALLMAAIVWFVSGRITGSDAVLPRLAILTLALASFSFVFGGATTYFSNKKK